MKDETAAGVHWSFWVIGAALEYSNEQKSSA